MATRSDRAEKELRSIRDTVLSVWVAIVLAFVLRAFMIEAFVIPTGSMAPRLMGEHWSLHCPHCGWEYPYGDPRGHRDVRGSVSYGRPYLPQGAHCPNCGASYDRPAYVNGGDRVLVLKYVYNFAQPQPFDVVVFKNPQDNRTNYIKRLIGLPGEQIQIVHGDIFVRTGDEEPWRIRRKPPAAQDVMWQVIYDNDYPPDAEQAAKVNGNNVYQAPRWVPAQPEDQDAWTVTDQQGLRRRAIAFAGSDVPRTLALSAPRNNFGPRYGYNKFDPTNPDYLGDDISLDHDVCTDLKLSFSYIPASADSRITLGLTSFEHVFWAEVAADGSVGLFCRSATLTAGQAVQWGSANVGPLRLNRGVEVALTHADFRLTLWVNGKAVLASTDEQYSPDLSELKQWMKAPAPAVPQPRVTLTAAGGQARFEHVQVMRDVYYTCANLRQVPDPNGPAPEAQRYRYMFQLLQQGLLQIRVRDNEPLGWGTMDNPITLKDDPVNDDLDEFFVLGDNSPQSLDGRMWTTAAPTLRLWTADGQVLHRYQEGAQPLYKLGTVPRYAMIGRALFVYWPSGYRIPGLERMPILPNVGKMRLIR